MWTIALLTVATAKESNLTNMPIGIGVFAWYDILAYDSEEVNTKYFVLFYNPGCCVLILFLFFLGPKVE